MSPVPIRKRAAVVVSIVLLVAVAAWPVGAGKVAGERPAQPNVEAHDVEAPIVEEPVAEEPVAEEGSMEHAVHADAVLAEPIDLVFLHHSIGGQLLADEGPDDGKGRVHPNGGGLRRALEANGYRVHTATYGSRIGEHTDVFDWLPKFRDDLETILRTDTQDATLPNGARNRVVLWKSCYPNNDLVGEGAAPGSPSGPALTVANAKAMMRSLLPIFAAHPDTLFVHLTTPPILGVAASEPLLFTVVKRVLGRPTRRDKLERAGRLSEEYQRWVASSDGWLAGYRGANVVVFDYYRLLSDDAGFTRYASLGGTDPHPSAEGNRRAAAALVPFVSRAVRRAGLAPER